MPNFFSGLTGALTAARTGQLQGQNQGALENFAIQMQLANMARANRAQDIADAAEQARASYYQGQSDRGDTIQRRQDALAGIRPGKTATGADVNAAAAPLREMGLQAPELPADAQLQEAGTATGKVDEQGNPITIPIQQLGKGEVYDPSQNLQAQLTQQKLDAAMEREKAREAAAKARTELRINQGPSGVRTEDAKAFSRLVIQQTGILSRTHPGAVSGINEPGLPAEQAAAQAVLAAAMLYPEEALRRYPHNPAVIAAAQKGLAIKQKRSAGGGGTSAPPTGGTSFNAPVPGLPGLGSPSGAGTGIPGVPTTPTRAGVNTGGAVATVVARLKEHPEDVIYLDGMKNLTEEEKDAVRQQLANP